MMDHEINPNAPRLRPLGIGEIISHTFSIYAKNWFDFIILAALITVPLMVINIIFNNVYGDDLLRWQTMNNTQTTNTEFTDQDIEALVAVLAFAGLSIVGSIIQYIFINSTMTVLASEVHLGYKASIDKAFSLAWSRFFSFGALMLMLLFLFIVLSIILGIAAICLVPILLFPVLIYYMILSFLLLTPVMMLERAGISRGLSRVIALGRARFWPILGTTFLLSILSYLVIFIFNLPSFVALSRDISEIADLGTSQFNVNQAFTDQPLIYNILSMIGAILILPLSPIALTVLYYDARVRVERLDVGLQIVKGSQPRPRDLPSPEPKDDLFSMTDFVNILLLTVIGILFMGIYLGFIFFILGLSGSAI